MSSRVLAIGINSKYVHTNLSIRYFREYSNCEIFECSVNDNLFDVYSKLLEKSQSIFAFSVYIWNRDFVVNLIKMLKNSRPDLTIIAGGPEAAFSPETFFDLCPDTDAIATGEGENTFYALEQNLPLSEVPNLTFKTFKTKTLQTDLSKVKFPYRKEEIKDSKILYFETSRGCIFNCTYCLSSAMEKTRYFPDEYVKNGIDFFIENNVHLVKLVDRTFNDNDERCCDILEYIINNSKHTHFHFEISPLLITDRFISLCEQAGNLIQLEIGIQTVNYNTMKEIKRIFDLDKVRENIMKIPSSVHTHMDIIAGLPDDTKETVENAFNYVYSLKPDMLQLGFLKVLNGTEMSNRKSAFDIKTTPFPPYEVTSTSTISPTEMIEIKRTENAVDKIYNSGSFKRTVEKMNSDNMYKLYEKIGERLFLEEYTAPLSKNKLYEVLLDILGMEFKEVLALDFLDNNKKANLPEIFTDKIPNLKELHKKIKMLNDFKDKKIRLTVICGKTYIICEDGIYNLSDYSVNLT